MYGWDYLERKYSMKGEPRAELTHKSSACPAAFMPASAFILLSALDLSPLTYLFILAGARLCFFLSIISSGDSPMLFLAFVLKWFYIFCNHVSLQTPQRLSWLHGFVHATTQKAAQGSGKEPENLCSKFGFARSIIPFSSSLIPTSYLFNLISDYFLSHSLCSPHPSSFLPLSPDLHTANPWGKDSPDSLTQKWHLS